METLTATRKTVVLDLRLTPPQERRFRIFDIFDNLRVGDTLKVMFDRDLQAVRQLLSVHRRGDFSWESHEESQTEWSAWIRKLR
ncbi:MAG: DUF2249 domain-containing protein [Chloroflexi bacterium]|nr:DUF2249 domain-containing protein [Chloroflexota bacterium]